MFLAGGVLTRHEAEIGHKLTRRLEPAKIVQLGQHQHRRQRVDAAEASQPPRPVAIGRRIRMSASQWVEFEESSLNVIDRQQIIVDDHPFGGVRPHPDSSIHRRCAFVQLRPLKCRPRRSNNLPRRWRPRCRSSRASSRARAQIPHRLVFGRRRVHLGQQARAQQLHQLARITPIRLDSLTGLPRDQRRRVSLDRHPRRRHLPPQRVPARPGFVAHAHGAWRFPLQFPLEADGRPV